MTVPMALLTLLEPSPAHGFALKARYDRLLGWGAELRYGQVYATLSRLERDGLTTDDGVEPGAGADRRLYRITRDGMTQVEDWLRSPVEPGGRAAELFVKVVLALASGRPAAKILAVQRATHMTRMRELTGARNKGTVLDRLAGDYEIAHLDADLQWMDIASSRLGALAKEVRS